jgi:tetratricopeptide (TPR) repeat protein
MPSTFASSSLSIDGNIIKELGNKKAKVVVIGPHLVGLSTTRQRVLAELSQRNITLSNDQVIDLPIDASAQEVGQALSKARTRQVCVVFLHDFWKEIAETKPAPVWIAGDEFVLGQLNGFLREFHEINHLVKNEDAKSIINSYWDSHNIPPDDIRSPIIKSIISISKLGDTHIPMVIHEKLEKWTESNPTVVEKLKHRTRLREDEEAIASAFKKWEAELKEDLSNYDRLLGMFGLGSAASELLGTSLGATQGVLKVFGISAASTAFVFGLPVALTLFVAAALGFAASSKKDLPHAEMKEFMKYTIGFLTAQKYWIRLTPAQKEVICYELDKKTRSELGTALRELTKHFAVSTDPEDPGENLIKAIENDLGTKLETILTAKILAEVDKLLAPMEAQITELFGEQKRMLGKMATLEQLLGLPPTIINSSNSSDIPNVLKVPWVRDCPPIRPNGGLRKKLLEAVRYVSNAEDVLITGEAMIGKSTFMYAVCSELLAVGKTLYTGGLYGIQAGSIYVADDIGANPTLADNLDNLAVKTCVKLAAARSTDLVDEAKWKHVIHLTRGDYSTMLEDMLQSLLKADKVEHDEEGMAEAVERSRGLPGYLSVLVTSLKLENKKLTKDTASLIPDDIYKLVAKMIEDLGERDLVSLAVLRVIALAVGRRLHDEQVMAVKALVQEIFSQKGAEIYESYLLRYDLVFYLAHDVWKEVLAGEKTWSALGIGIQEPKSLLRVRSKVGKDVLVKALGQSVEQLGSCDARNAEWVALIALENSTEFADKILDMVLKSKDVNFKTLLAEQIAMHSPKTVTDFASLEHWKKHWKNLGVRRRAPNFTVLFFGRLVSIYRELAESDPVYRGGLAMSLRLLGDAYGYHYTFNGAIDFDAAIKALKEALSINRELAESNPAYRKDLARSLRFLGNAYDDQCDFDAAIKALKEALSINRELAESNPAYRKDLARSLITVGDVYYDQKDFDAAIKADNEALDIFRELAESDPVYRGDLAHSLIMLGNAYSHQPNLNAAMQTHEEASKILRELAKSDPVYRLQLALNLNMVGETYYDQKDFDAAIKADNEALDIFRELAESDPVYRGDLAHSLIVQGCAYWEQNDFDAAIKALKEALSINRELAESNPAYRGDLARSLITVGDVYYTQKDFDAAILTRKEALKIFRELVESNPAYRKDLARSLSRLGTTYSAKTLTRAELDIAILIMEEAVKLYMELVATQPELQADFEVTKNFLNDLRTRH